MSDRSHNQGTFQVFRLPGLQLSASDLVAQTPPAKPLRLGFVGVGNRGSYHLDCALGVELEVVALCDIDDKALYRGERLGGGGGPSFTAPLRRQPDGVRSVVREGRAWTASSAAPHGNITRPCAFPL